MLDISAVDFKTVSKHKEMDYIYYIKEDKIYRSSDILDATEPGTNIVSLDYVKELLPKWHMCRIFRSYSIDSILQSWNHRHGMVYSRINDFLQIKGRISNIEKLYSKLEQEIPEVIKINNNIDKFRRLWSNKTIAELKEITKSSIFTSNVDLLYYFSDHDMVKFDKNTFYYIWNVFTNKEEIYSNICRYLEMNKNKSNFNIIDSYLSDDNKVIESNLLKLFAQLLQMKLLEEMK